MIATCNEKIILRKIFVSEKRLSDIDFKRSKKALVCMENKLINSDNNMLLMLLIKLMLL